jgi:uncharacterized protein (TIGR02099 family)
VVRIAAKSVIAVVGGFCALLLALRLVAFPQVEAHRAEIAQWLGARIGQPVEIDSLVTGWDGWNPKLAIGGFRVRDRANAGGTLLELPRVDLVIAWTSLPLLDLRLKALLIESPRLAVRRDTAGRLHIAGIEMESETDVDDSGFADWLMRQPQIVVRDALVTWNDDLRRAPQLLLDHVQFRLVQRFGHHHAGLTGVPPPELAAPIDLRADLTGRSLKDLESLSGKLYLRLDYADVAAWREWVPMPIPVESGKGALRVWVDFARSKAIDVVADLELADVHATLGDALPPLALAHVGGRAGWKRTGTRTQFVATGLSFALPDGTVLPPTDLTATLVDPVNGTSGSGSIASRQLDLRPLAAIAPHLPLPADVRDAIARYEPRGALANATIDWTGVADAPERYSVKGEFRGLGFAAGDALPGAANVSGSLEANERGGTVHVASEAVTLALPKVFAEPLRFDSVAADVTWQRDESATRVQWKNVQFANADLAGSAAGSWRSLAAGPGEIDMKAQLARANLASVHRYLPAAAGPGLRAWVQRALVKGTSGDARLVLSGDLALFPFAQGKGGQFQIAFKARDTTLDYAQRWPAVTDIAADVRLDGARLSVSATGARVMDAQIGATRGEIADLRDANPVVHIDGTVTGATSQFLAFIANSPLAERIGRVTDDATASGDGRLALTFDLPLHDVAQTTLSGTYRFLSNTVRVGAAPQLANVNGELAFSAREAHATELTAEAFGGPVRLQFTSEDGRVRLGASGTANAQLVRGEFDIPLLERMSGRADWKLVLDAHDRDVAWKVESSLEGAAIDLPAPIGKRAADSVALRIERREAKPREDRVTVDYGGIARVVLHRELTQPPAVDRALVLLGKAIGDAEPEQPGVWIRGDVAALDLDEWLAVARNQGGTPPKDGAADPFAVNGVDLRAADLQVLGRHLTELKATARRQNADWRLTLDGKDLAGTAVWRGATPAQPNGRIVARLARLTPPRAVEATNTPGAGAAAPSSATVNQWPAVDLVADSLHSSKDKVLGKLELLAQPSGTDWQIQKLALVNDAGRIDAQGSWRNSAGNPQTWLDVAIDVKEAGQFLGRFGWPDAVKGAPTKIEGQVSWTGAPSEFDYASLSGSFKLQSGAGQFTKLDPGVGRLLGVLSLQALPRRITLDFRDVFSEGFAFDTVSGDVRMQSGVMHTDAFRLVGPSAAVNIAGDVDLAAETQQLRVRVQPSLSSGVSAGAAALFIANPLIGAAVGAGTLLAQKMLNNPFDQLFSYEYAVSGAWDDPVVTRVGARPETAAQSSATIR